jgi:ABC-type spermidine/putrescine transport system permease subunit I
MSAIFSRSSLLSSSALILCSAAPLAALDHALLLRGCFAAGLLFAVPVVASASFGFTLPDQGFTFKALGDAVAGSSFALQVLQSLVLAALTTAASFALLIPTLVWLHLHAQRQPRFRCGTHVFQHHSAQPAARVADRGAALVHDGSR